MVIGLDYGTTTTLAISWKNGRIHEEARLLSSVFIDKEHHILTDEEAYKKRTALDGVYVHSPKSLLGNFNTFGNSDDYLNIRAKDLVCATLDALFDKIRLEGNDDMRITLTVPNAWRDQQYVMMRECVFRSAEKAFGPRFDKDRFAIIPEPVAAALHFIIKKELYGNSDTNYVVVCDVGGGTSDLAVVKCEKYNELYGIDLQFEVVCPMEGAPGLGGDNFDKELQLHLLPRGVPASVPDHVVWNSIRMLKSQLSSQECAKVPLVKSDGTLLLDGRNQPRFLSCTRYEFESLIRSYLDHLHRMLAELARKLSEYDPTCDLSKVYLLPVGGSCRIPAIRRLMQEVFRAQLIDLDNEREETYDSIASGAACYSAWLAHGIPGYHDIVIKNKLPHRLSIKYGENALETWVAKNDPDGDYCPKMLYPVCMNADGETFRIGTISVYQGDGSSVTEQKNELLLELSIDTPIHAHGRPLDDIPVRLVVCVRSARIHEIRLVVEAGNADSSDFVYTQIVDR